MDTGALRELGLSEYQSKAYAALLCAGRPLGGREVASLSGVPASRVYDVLRGLEKKKLVALTRNDPMTFEAVDPELGMDAYLAEANRKMADAKAQFFSELKKMPQGVGAAGDEHEFIKVYFGKEHRFARSLPLYRAAKKRIWVIARSDSLPSFLLREVAAAKKRGVDHRVITTQLDDKNRDTIEAYRRVKAVMRFDPGIRGFNQLVFDDDSVYQVFYDPANMDDLCVVVIRNRGYNKMLAEFFESAWRRAQPVMR